MSDPPYEPGDTFSGGNPSGRARSDGDSSTSSSADRQAVVEAAVTTASHQVGVDFLRNTDSARAVLGDVIGDSPIPYQPELDTFLHASRLVDASRGSQPDRSALATALGGDPATADWAVGLAATTLSTQLTEPTTTTTPRRPPRRVAAVVIGLAVTATLIGIGIGISVSRDDSETPNTTEKPAITERPDTTVKSDTTANNSPTTTAVGPLTGVRVTVGSKDFTENILLGEMIAQALEAQGADIDDQISLGQTPLNREAVLAGDIDVYPEYTGTGWSVHLRQQDPSFDPQKLYEDTAAKDLAENGIQWVGLSPFNDTFGFATNGELAEAEGGFSLQEMADHLEANPDASVCMETDFAEHRDGLILFEQATGYEVPAEQQQILDTRRLYTAIASGACDFGEVFTTDGRITALNLELVEDPGVFRPYNVSFTWADSPFQEHANIYREVADSILAPLDDEKMSELNAKVDVDGESTKAVAAAYLREIGLV